MKKQTVLVLDFGGQYNQLIARRVREQHVYCELIPYSTPMEKIKAKNPVGIIFTGGPNSVYAENAPRPSEEVFKLGVPILGICYGCQLIADFYGGKVSSGPREYGKKALLHGESPLFDSVPQKSDCWMSHTDYVEKLPKGFVVSAYTDTCPV
ncbi:MAG: glutamine-hydrolyzing GMP synthase, partial [Clostridiales bacterium]|nr:glutamine-hydrolyzing GMP synthase [Clostridiales bacterium]